MQFTVNQAAKIVGATRQTIYRHIESKPISVIKDENGNQLIDASELVRVYGNDINFDALNTDTKSDDTEEMLQPVTRKAADVTPSLEDKIQLVKLEAQIEMLKSQLESKEEENEYVKKLLEEEKAERKAANNLLEDHRVRENKWDKQFQDMESRISNVEKSSKIWEGRARKLNAQNKVLKSEIEEKSKSIFARIFE